MNGRGLKISNEYAQQFRQYPDIPKAVFAAVAFSLSMRLNQDDASSAVGEFYREWRALHLNGIVAQEPPSRPAARPDYGTDAGAAGRAAYERATKEGKK